MTNFWAGLKMFFRLLRQILNYRVDFYVPLWVCAILVALIYLAISQFRFYEVEQRRFAAQLSHNQMETYKLTATVGKELKTITDNQFAMVEMLAQFHNSTSPEYVDVEKKETTTDKLREKIKESLPTKLPKKRGH